MLVPAGISGLKYLRDKAGRERDLRALFRGRALHELLENADDAGAKNAVFILGQKVRDKLHLHERNICELKRYYLQLTAYMNLFFHI